MGDNLEYPDDHVMHPGAMLHQGLIIAGFSLTQIEQSQPSANNSWFNSPYGASPTVVCYIYEDLVAYKCLQDPCDAPRGMPKKITRSDDLGVDELWIMTVDGTHCWITEPGHPNVSQDREYYSHKFNKAGINYKLGIALSSNKLIWMNGPFKAGQNDVIIFVEKGLEQWCLRNLCTKFIGDGGYCRHNDTASTPNVHDGYRVKRFKARALKQNEGFNGMTKVLRILGGRF
eukprot:jgi/Psemu1/35290/gm1.35290_g